MSKTGERNRLIIFETSEGTEDEYGQPIDTWGEAAKSWSKVIYGAGRERREAAKEDASQSATFNVLWTPTLANLPMTARIQHDGGVWDIVSRAPIGLNRELDFDAVRKV